MDTQEVEAQLQRLLSCEPGARELEQLLETMRQDEALERLLETLRADEARLQQVIQDL